MPPFTELRPCLSISLIALSSCASASLFLPLCLPLCLLFYSCVCVCNVCVCKRRPCSLFVALSQTHTQAQPHTHMLSPLHSLDTRARTFSPVSPSPRLDCNTFHLFPPHTHTHRGLSENMHTCNTKLPPSRLLNSGVEWSPVPPSLPPAPPSLSLCFPRDWQTQGSSLLFLGVCVCVFSFLYE